MNARRRRVRNLLAGALVIPVFGMAVAVAGAGAAAAAPAITVPLAGAVSGPDGAYAIVAMGQLGTPLNTFWELFGEPTGASRWSLITPAGVADNGGLTATRSSDPLVVGFEPSQLLRYSPLAVSDNGGATWAPSLLPMALAGVPDALAVQPGTSGGAGRAVALVRGGRVLVAPTTLSRWSTLVNLATLRATARAACAVNRLGAVALVPGGGATVGTGCALPGRIGVFTDVSGTWRLTGPALTGGAQHSVASVLRLGIDGTSTTGLAGLVSGPRRGLVTFSQPAGGSWTVSAPLWLAAGSSLIATSVGADGSTMVLMGRPGRRPVPAEIAPGGGWTVLPAAPRGTAALASMPDGSVDALVVDRAVLHVSALGPGSSTWTTVQTINVPIAYGSS